MATHSSILTWRVLWTSSLAGHRVAKSQTQPFLVRICFSNRSMWVRLFCNLHIFFLFLVVLFSKNEIQCAFPVYWVWATLKWPIPWKLGGSPLHLRWCVLGALRGTLLPPCFWIRSSPVSTGKKTLSAKLKDFNNEPCVPLPFLFTAFPLRGVFRGGGGVLQSRFIFPKAVWSLLIQSRTTHGLQWFWFFHVSLVFCDFDFKQVDHWFHRGTFQIYLMIPHLFRWWSNISVRSPLAFLL